MTRRHHVKNPPTDVRPVAVATCAWLLLSLPSVTDVALELGALEVALAAAWLALAAWWLGTRPARRDPRRFWTWWLASGLPLAAGPALAFTGAGLAARIAV